MHSSDHHERLVAYRTLVGTWYKYIPVGVLKGANPLLWWGTKYPGLDRYQDQETPLYLGR